MNHAVPILLFIASGYQFGIMATIAGGLVYLLYLCEIYNTLDITLKNAYNKYKGVRSLVILGGGYKNIFLGTMTLLYKTAWHALLSFMNNTVSKFDNNRNVINISTGGKLYSILVKNDRKPDSILQVIDENCDDVTNKVLPYLRFKQILIDLTPQDLGYNELQILTIDNDPVDIKGDEPIII